MHEMQGEPSSWLEACDDASKLWSGILLDQVIFIDRVNYFTAQNDSMGIPMPEPGIRMVQDRARPGVLIC